MAGALAGLGTTPEMLVHTDSKDTEKNVVVAMETGTRTAQAVAMSPGTLCAAAKRR